MGRRLQASFVLRGKGTEGPIPSFDELASPVSEHLLGLQVSASRMKERRIVPSRLTGDLVRQHVKLRADTPSHHVRTYLAPWVTGDTAFVVVGVHCGLECGYGTGYALRKESGKWRVIAAQNRWIA